MANELIEHEVLIQHKDPSLSPIALTCGVPGPNLIIVRQRQSNTATLMDNRNHDLFDIISLIRAHKNERMSNECNSLVFISVYYCALCGLSGFCAVSCGKGDSRRSRSSHAQVKPTSTIQRAIERRPRSKAGGFGAVQKAQVRTRLDATTQLPNARMPVHLPPSTRQ